MMEGIKVLEARTGELRLAVDRVKDNHQMASELEERFGAVKGIYRVEANPEQGTVLVHYNKDELTSLFNLWSLKDAFASLFPDTNPMELLSLLGDKD